MNGSRNIAVRALLGAVTGIALAGLLASPAAATGQGGGKPWGTAPAPKVVATVTGAGVTVTFLADSGPDGQQRIALREEGSLDNGASPVAALVAQRYTAQEIYLALAPSGGKAPAALAKLQGAEAARAGRDSGVRVVRATPEAAAQRSVARCTEVLGPWARYGRWIPTGGSYSSGSHTRHVGGGSGYATVMPIALAACNQSNSVTLTGSYAYNQRFNSLGWQDSDTYPVGRRAYMVFYLQSYNGSVGTSYRVNATSTGAFDLVTAEWEEVPE